MEVDDFWKGFFLEKNVVGNKTLTIVMYFSGPLYTLTQLQLNLDIFSRRNCITIYMEKNTVFNFVHLCHMADGA